MKPRTEDDTFMQAALEEARRGIGLTAPNPPVGAVIVKNGTVIGKGWHRRAGEPHAEIEALRDAEARREDVKNAVIYITLEPCSTHGRTPPCVDALIAAGISRVVWGATDPNPPHAGRAEKLLKENGIAVSTGVCEADCREILRPFAKRITTGLPWVIAKAGMSLDGKITRPAGEGQWLTSEAARMDAMRLRVRADAILVGAETIRQDNPSLTLRGPDIPAGKGQPWRAVLTRSGDLPADSRIFTDEFREKTLVFRDQPLERVLRDLAGRGVMTVLAEGGGQVLAQLFSQKLVDEAVFYVAPLISGSGRPVVNPAAFPGGSGSLEFQEIERIGVDLKITALVREEGDEG